jgi:hypothetical protein
VKLGALAEGVPEITPVVLVRLSPAGSAPLDIVQLSGAVPPVDARVVEYAVPTVALGNAFVVIDSAGATVIESTFVVEAPTLSVS